MKPGRVFALVVGWLDQGGSEPTRAPLVPPPAGSSVADLRETDRQEVAR
jgi:hypothetical protein